MPMNVNLINLVEKCVSIVSPLFQQDYLRGILLSNHFFSEITVVLYLNTQKYSIHSFAGDTIHFILNRTPHPPPPCEEDIVPSSIFKEYIMKIGNSYF